MTGREEQRRRAEAFRELHEALPVLVLPGVWDVCSARLFEVEGFDALGTTSAGIAATLGFPDGENVTRDEMVAAVRRIIENVDIPVSADMEAGYGRTPDAVMESTLTFLKAGAAGVNIEDGTGNSADPLFDPSLQSERLAAAREAAVSEGVPLFINARIDVFLVSDDSVGARLARTLDRAKAYLRAGADGIFVPTPLDRPGLLDRTAIARLVGEIGAPLNVLGGSVTPPLADLEELGVARVSLGPGPMRAALALIRKIARELKREGTYTGITADSISYAEVNDWFQRHP